MRFHSVSAYSPDSDQVGAVYMKCNDLKDTIELMLSEDSGDRFWAEYWQLKIRHDRLRAMLDKYETRSLDFELECSPAILKRQLSWMREYLKVLEYRADVEGIQNK